MTIVYHGQNCNSILLSPATSGANELIVFRSHSVCNFQFKLDPTGKKLTWTCSPCYAVRIRLLKLLAAVWSCVTVFSHFLFHLGFQKATNRIQSLHQYSSRNILADLWSGWSILANLRRMGFLCLFFFFFFFFLIITFNMQHAVISIHVRDKLHATDDVTKLLDNFQSLRRGWSSDIQSRTSF